MARWRKALETFVISFLASGAFVGVARLTIPEKVASVPMFAVVLIFLLLVALLFFIIRHFRKDVPNYEPVKHNFHVKQKSVEMIFGDDGTITYTKSKLLKSRTNNIRGYEDKFNWTGDGLVDIKSGNDTHDLEMLSMSGIWQKYRTNFNKTVNKGDEILVETVWTLNEANRRMSPFISQSVEEPTHEIVFRLKFCDNRVPKAVFKESMDNIASIDPFETIEDRSGNAEYEWKIEKPKLLHNYQLRWIES